MDSRRKRPVTDDAMKDVRKLLSEEDGVSLIETAIAVLTMLVLLVGVLEFTRALYAEIYIGYVAHSATRYAMVRGTTFTGTSCATPQTENCVATADNIASFAKAAAPLGIAAVTNLTVTSTWPGTGATGAACNTSNGANSPGCVVMVQVTYNFRFALPVISTSSMLLKSSSVVIIVE